MALEVCSTGEVLALKRLLNHTAADDCKLKLYSDNITPDDDSVPGSFTECAIAGYAAKTLTGASWTVETSESVTTGSYAEQTFSFTGSGTVYGYFVTDNAGTTLIWAEKFAAAIPITSGDSIAVTPQITAD